ncbi:alpha/beta hydrolase family protein [Cohnella hongkongensis]|uniref:Alpha/beta hydrolase family protein n=1 Tax=Cohnella hongkongensis TaxID=178337 RepID=A0ABV9FHC7_9BACL
MIERIHELERYVCSLYETKDQLSRHIYQRADRAFEAGDAARDRIDSPKQLAARRQAMKKALLKSMGGLPASDAPLNASITNVVVGQGYSVENIVFEARPHEYVTGNLYLPQERALATPAVLFLNGHEAEGKHCLYYHEVCLRLVQAGLIVFSIDPIGQGERLSLLRNAEGQEVGGTGEHQRLGVQCYALGQGVARYFVHDAIRAVDYLASRPEVDSTRIGATGNSGGGLQTAMMMVCDERIAAAAPATFIMNRQQYMYAGGVQDAEQVWQGLSGLGFDHEDVLLAFAPKPLLVCAATYDFFPIEATRRTVQRCRRFWEMLGAETGLRLVEDQSVHRYTDDLAIAAADFFAKHLLGCNETERETYRDKARRSKLAPLRPEQLRCTSGGQVKREYADARTPSDTFAIQAAELAQARVAVNEQSDAAREWLKRIVLTDRERCELNPRFVQSGSLDGLSIRYALWWSQPGLMNSGYCFHANEGAGSSPGGDCGSTIAMALWPGGTTQLTKRWNWIRSMCASGRKVLVLNVSGDGPHEPNLLYGRPNDRFFGMTHKLADELIWLGDSLAALRVYDVLRAASFAATLSEPGDCRIELYGAGLFRIYTELAGQLDTSLRVKRLSDARESITLSEWLAQGIADERDVMSVIIPGILRYYDLQIDHYQ